MLYFLDPLQYRFMPKCVFKLITGYDCPGCGFQRAVHALLHGRISEAIHYNLFLLVGIPYLLAIVFANFLPYSKKKQKMLAVLEGRALAYSYVVLFFLWMIIRNILKI